ncbi:hypothetical protein BDR26DRAFT_868265 [Obelidium mucronatum]|nr:hypothetical protein BDR26DRAFT_868265 [Obelidium mucronatum]
MDQETQEFAANAKAFAASVSDLEALLLPLFAVPFDELVLKSEDLIDRASLCVLFSYIINTLAFLYLRTQGATKGHPVRKELARVKEYMDKVSAVAGSNKPPTQLDQNAAKRFIKHTLSNNPEIKEKYKEEERSAQAEQFLDSILAATQESSNSANAPASAATSTPSSAAGQKRVRNDVEDASSSRKRSQKKTPKKSPKLK